MDITLTGDRRQTLAILLLRCRLSSGEGISVQLSPFSREIPCETTATRKVTAKPLILSTAVAILIIVSPIDIFARLARI